MENKSQSSQQHPIDTLETIKGAIGDIHFDLYRERRKMQVLYYASDKADEEGRSIFDGGLTSLIGDTGDNLQELCDRLERVTLDLAR